MLLTYLVALFVGLPLMELFVLLRLGEHMGWAPTLLLVVVTGVAGAWLARVQGLMVLRDIQCDLAEGRMPAPRLMDGVMILVAGALLLTPGLITDTAGFLLLVPVSRTLIRQWLRAKLEHRLREGTVHFTYHG